MAAKAGSIEDQYILEKMYYLGLGVNVNKVEGLSLLEKAADKGHIAATVFMNRVEAKKSEVEKR